MVELVRQPRFQIVFALMVAAIILGASWVAPGQSLIIGGAIAAAYLVANFSLLSWAQRSQ